MGREKKTERKRSRERDAVLHLAVPVPVPEKGGRNQGVQARLVVPFSVAPSSTSLLKRKRPVRIDIPLTEAVTFAAPVGSDGRKEFEAESTHFSVYCKRGRKRLEMEDGHMAELDLHGDPQMTFFGICDGHGGKRAAEFALENMCERIVGGLALRGGGGGSCSEMEEKAAARWRKLPRLGT